MNNLDIDTHTSSEWINLSILQPLASFASGGRNFDAEPIAVHWNESQIHAQPPHATIYPATIYKHDEEPQHNILDSVEGRTSR
jgi:hypothetical protein